MHDLVFTPTGLCAVASPSTTCLTNAAFFTIDP